MFCIFGGKAVEEHETVKEPDVHVVVVTTVVHVHDNEIGVDLLANNENLINKPDRKSNLDVDLSTLLDKTVRAAVESALQK